MDLYIDTSIAIHTTVTFQKTNGDVIVSPHKYLVYSVWFLMRSEIYRMTNCQVFVLYINIESILFICLSIFPVIKAAFTVTFNVTKANEVTGKLVSYSKVSNT